jgi:hypothetical protein
MERVPQPQSVSQSVNQTDSRHGFANTFLGDICRKRLFTTHEMAPRRLSYPAQYQVPLVMPCLSTEMHVKGIPER